MKILISIKDGFTFMPRISREDYESLEKKIQTGIQKIFSQFIEDLENKTSGSGKTVPAADIRKPGRPRTSGPEESDSATSESKKRSQSKRLAEMNKILHGTTHAGANRSRKILESDMEKIFRKKQRKGSQ
jgi:hypothetical protein